MLLIEHLKIRFTFYWRFFLSNRIRIVNAWMLDLFVMLPERSAWVLYCCLIYTPWSIVMLPVGDSIEHNSLPVGGSMTALWALYDCSMTALWVLYHCSMRVLSLSLSLSPTLYSLTKNIVYLSTIHSRKLIICKKISERNVQDYWLPLLEHYCSFFSENAYLKLSISKRYLHNMPIHSIYYSWLSSLPL